VPSFLVVFTVLVFFHELGHYLIARFNGVKVSTFSIGFGREIFGWNDRHGTRWKVSVIPLGGYVKFFGDMGPTSAEFDETMKLTSAEQSVTFHHKRLGQRAAIVAAGPLANFVLAIVIMTVLFMAVGRPVTPAVVESVLPNSAAAAAGIMPGDRVVEADGQVIDRFETLQQIIRMKPEEKMPLIVARAGKDMTLSVTPRSQVVTDDFGSEHTIGLLGISTTGAEYVTLGSVAAVREAVAQTGEVVRVTFQALGQMVKGTRSTSELGGPIRIAQMSGQVAQQGIAALAMFTAMLSINLGLINFFPIPMLDGGHLLFYCCEAVLGHPLSERAQEIGLRFGLVLVMMLMVFATWNDLSSLPFGKLFSHILS